MKTKWRKSIAAILAMAMIAQNCVTVIAEDAVAVTAEEAAVQSEEAAPVAEEPAAQEAVSTQEAAAEEPAAQTEAVDQSASSEAPAEDTSSNIAESDLTDNSGAANTSTDESAASDTAAADQNTTPAADASEDQNTTPAEEENTAPAGETTVIEAANDSLEMYVGDTLTITGGTGEEDVWQSANESAVTLVGSGNTAVLNAMAAGEATIIHSYKAEAWKSVGDSWEVSENYYTETWNVTITEKVTKPAYDYTGSCDGINVEIHAPEGVFPEGTTVELKAMSQEAIAAAASYMGCEEADVLGLDITFRAADGSEIEPEGDVSVSFSSAQIAEASVSEVHHMQDDGSIETVSASQENDCVGFTADSFSTWFINGGTGEDEISTVDAYNGETTIYIGESATLTGTSNTSYDWQHDDSWSSSDTGIASVSKDGNYYSSTATVTGVKAGTATITHTYYTRSGGPWGRYTSHTETFTVIVKAKTAPTAISISGSDTVEAFKSIALTAVFEPADASGSVSWSVDDDSIASIDSNGNLTGAKPGEVTVTAATFDAEGNILTATKTVTVTRTQSSTDQAQFYYMSVPDGDPSRNDSVWGPNLGNGTVNVTGGSFQDDNKNLYNADSRVVSWPAGLGTDNGDGTLTVTRGSSNWNEIFNYYQSYVSGQLGVNITQDDVTEIKLSAYKISQNNGTNPDKHVDCTVVITCKNVATVTWNVWEAGASGYSFYDAENVTAGSSVSLDGTTKYAKSEPASEVTKDGKKYIFVGWYTNQNLTGEKVSFPYTADGNVTFYGKYVRADLQYTVNYYLNGTTQPVSPSITKTGNQAGAVVVQTAKTLEGYTLASEGSVSITLSEDGNNEINFFYYKNVTLTAGSDTVTYDGAEHTVQGYTCSEGAGITFAEIAAPSVSGTDAGSYPVNFADSDGDGIADAVGKISDDGKYIVTATENGTLTINKRNITLTSGTSEKTYDGSALTNGTVTVGGEGFVSGQGAEYSVTGSQTEAGESTNTFSYTLKEGTLEDNYNITRTEGTLKVNPITDKVVVTIVGNSKTEKYNGEEKSTNGYTVKEISNNLYTAGDFSFTGTAEAKGTNAGTYQMGLAAGQFTNNNTNFSNVEFVVTDGSLTISKRDVTLTSKTASKQYDGNALTNGTVTVSGDGFVEGQGASYDVTGSQTEIGESDNTFSYTLNEGTLDSNYNITKVEGKLTVTNITDEVIVTITGNKATYTYNGTEKTVSGYTYSANNSLYTDKDFAFTGKAVAKGTNAGTYAMGLTEDQFSNTNSKFTNVTFVIVDGGLTINPVEDEVKVVITGNTASKIYNGEEQKVEGYQVSTNNRLYTAKDFEFNGDAAAKGTNADTYAMGLTAKQFTNTNTNFTDVTFEVTDGSLTISKRNVTLTSGTSEKTYDGTALTNKNVTVGADGFVKNEGASYDVTGSQTAAGSSVNTFTYTLKEGTNKDNYNIAKTEGTLTVNRFTAEVVVTITGNTATETYDGKAKKAEGYTVSISNPLYKEGDFAFSGNKKAAGTDAGTYQMGLTAKQFTNTNESFTNVRFVVTDGSLIINRRNVTLTSGSGEKTYDGSALTNSAVAVGGDGFVEGQGASYSVTGSQTEAGSSENTFTYTLNEGTSANNYNITITKGTLKVNPVTAEVVVTITGKTATEKYDGTEKSAEGYTVSINNSLYKENYFAFSGNKKAAGTDAGTYQMGLKAEQFTNTNKNFENVTFVVTDGSLTIEKRNVTLTSATASKTYDGSALTNSNVTVSGEGFVEGQGASYNVTGSQTNAGSSKNTFTYTLNEGTSADNYNITKAEGDLTVSKVQSEVVVEIKGNSGTQKYDGTEKTVNGYTVTEISNKLYTANDFKFEGTAEAKGTDANTYSMGLTKDQFTNTNENFEKVTFVVTDGSLTIEKRNVTLTSATDSKTYDGSALTNGNVAVSGEGFVEGQGASYDVTGSQTNAGSSKNTFTFTLNKGTSADNYNITAAEGTLTVTAVNTEVVVTIAGNSKTEKYDGSEKSTTGYTVTEISNQLYTADDFSFNGTAEAKGTNAGSYTMGLAAGQFSNTNSNFTNVKFEVTDGKLTVNKRDVTLTSANGSKQYDGTALTNGTVTVSGDGFVEGQGAAYNVTGTQTEIGESENSFTYTLNEGTSKDNYNISTVNGKLIVTNVTDEVIVYITGNKETYTYDGTEKTVSGYTFTATNSLYTEKDFTFSGTAEAKGTDAGSYAMGLSAKQFSNTNSKFTNVTFVIVDGGLTINPIEDEVVVTITGNSATQKYNGAEQTVTGYQVSTNNSLYTDEDFTFNGTAEAKGTNAGSYTMGLAADQFRNTSSNFTNVRFEVTDGTLAIEKRNVTLTSATDNKTYDGTALTNNKVTVSGDAFVEGQGADYNVTGTITNVGSVDNAFTYSLKEGTSADNYNITKAVGTLKVTPVAAEVVVTITGNFATQKYNGAEHTVTGYQVSTNNSLYTDKDFTFNGTAEAKGTNAGSYTMGLAKDQFSNTNNNFEKVTFVVTDGSLTIEKRNITLTSASDSRTYDGTALTNGNVAVAGDGFVEGQGADYNVTGTITNVGSVDNAFTYSLKEGTSEDNYNITTAAGTLKVAPVTTEIVVTITGNSATAQYNGSEKNVTGYTVISNNTLYTENDFSFNGTAEAKGTNAGSYTMGLAANQFSNTSSNFTNVRFVVTDGTLTVDKRNVTLTSGSDEKTYDGTALTKNTVTVGGDGFAEGEGADYTVTGTITDAGSVDNAFTYSLKEGTLADNYNITEAKGTLTVNPVANEVVVTIIGTSAEEKYDGSEKSVTGYTVEEISSELYTADDFNFAGTAEAKGTNAGTYRMGLAKDQFSNTNGNFTNVKFEVTDGTLTINKRTVKLTSATDEKVYDRTALTNNTINIGGDGFASGEGAVYKVIGTITNAGSVSNAFTYTLKVGTLTDNYDITTEAGTLTVTPVTAEVVVTIIGNPATEKYDGTEKSAANYQVSSNNETYTTDDFTFSGTAEAKGTNAGTYNMGLAADQFRNTNSNFTSVKFVVTDGKLTVNKRDVTLTSATDSKQYDGTALTNGTVTVTGDGFAEGQGAAYNVTGTQTEIGETANAFTYTLNEGTSENNYNITKAEGKLTVTEVTDEVIVRIIGNKVTHTYDGTEKTVNGYTVSINNNAYTENDFTFTGTAEAKGTNAGTYSMGLTTEQFSNTNDRFTKVTFVIEDGVLTINPVTDEVVVTIVGKSDTKTYDGTEKTVEGYSFSANNSLYSQADVSFTGTAEAKGIYAGEYKMGLKDQEDLFTNTSTNFTNVKFVVNDGTLTITKPEDAVVISKSHEGDRAGLNDTVTFTITAKNIYNTAKTLTITEQEGVTITAAEGGTISEDGRSATFENVKSGEDVKVTATYTMKEEDIAAGSFKNTATVTVDGDSFDADNTVIAKDKNAHLTVTKTATSTPKNGESYTVGETITYNVNVKNDGNLTISNITVTDDLEGVVLAEEGSDKIEKLAPGEEANVTYTYTVTAEDVEAGSVINEATAAGTDPDNKEPEVEPGVDEEKTLDGSITVTKIVTAAGKMKAFDDYSVASGDDDVYVAVFSDEQCKDRVSDIVKYDLDGTYSDVHTFQGLVPGETYYVSETNESGTPLEAEQDLYTISPSANEISCQKVTIPNEGENKGKASTTIINAYNTDLPNDPRNAETAPTITINKTVVKDGSPLNVTATFYFALFADGEYTNRVSDVYALTLDNQSSETLQFEVSAAGVYYIAEVTEDGIPVSDDFDYVVYGETPVALSMNGDNTNVAIQNDLKVNSESDEETDGEDDDDNNNNNGTTNNNSNNNGNSDGSGTTSSTTTSTSGSSGSASSKNGSSSVSAVKTGDNTNIMIWIWIAAAAVVIIGATVYYRKKHKNSDQ